MILRAQVQVANIVGSNLDKHQFEQRTETKHEVRVNKKRRYKI